MRQSKSAATPDRLADHFHTSGDTGSRSNSGSTHSTHSPTTRYNFATIHADSGTDGNPDTNTCPHSDEYAGTITHSGPNGHTRTHAHASPAYTHTGSSHSYVSSSHSYFYSGSSHGHAIADSHPNTDTTNANSNPAATPRHAGHQVA